MDAAVDVDCFCQVPVNEEFAGNVPIQQSHPGYEPFRKPHLLQYLKEVLVQDPVKGFLKV